MSLLSKMMRICGRDPDGNSKAIRTDADGNVGVQLTGSILAKDPVSGEPKELAAIEDGDGNWVLKIVESAPAAYIDARNIIRVEAVEPKLVEIATFTDVEIPSASTYTDLINGSAHGHWDILFSQFSEVRWVCRWVNTINFDVRMTDKIAESAYGGQSVIISSTEGSSSHGKFDVYSEYPAIMIRQQAGDSQVIRWFKIFGVR